MDTTETVEQWAGIDLSVLVSMSELSMEFVVAPESQTQMMVTDAHPTDAIDPSPYIRPGELICTVGSVLTSATACANFVHALKTSDAVGICLGLGEVHLRAPKALITECQRNNLPLVEMGSGVPFTAINERLVSDRFRAHIATTERDERMMKRLLVMLQEEHEVVDLVRAAEEILGGRIRYQYRDTTAPKEDPVDTDLIPLPSSAQKARLGVGESIIWIPADAQDSIEQGALQHLGRALQISRRNTLEKRWQETKRMGELFAMIAEGLAHPGAVYSDLREKGLLEVPISVSAWPKDTFHLLANQFDSVLIADTGKMLFVVSEAPSRASEAADLLALVCGYSGTVDAADLQRGILESRAALRLARKRGQVCGPESLASLETLLELQPPGRLTPFSHQLIQPLLKNGIRGGKDLVRTLQLFIANNSSLQATAQDEFLHVNTVRHRLGRIRELVGKDPMNASDLVDLRIGLWVHEFGRPSTRRSG